jgi:hypothetical protein
MVTSRDPAGNPEPTVTGPLTLVQDQTWRPAGPRRQAQIPARHQGVGRWWPLQRLRGRSRPRPRRRVPSAEPAPTFQRRCPTAGPQHSASPASASITAVLDSYRRGRLCVSSLKEWGRSTGLVERSVVVGGGRQPTAWAMVQRPSAARRTTLGPSRADAGSTARNRSGPGPPLLWFKVKEQLHRQQPLAVGSPRGSGAGHPFAAPRRHGAVRPQPGGLNQTGDHAARRGS